MLSKKDRSNMSAVALSFTLMGLEWGFNRFGVHANHRQARLARIRRGRQIQRMVRSFNALTTSISSL